MRSFVLKVTAGAALLLAAAPLSAQSDILLQLRSGSPAGDRFRVDSAGGVVALGTLGYGIIPASGAGWRMMWHPQKSAFRAGYADAAGQFDESNIGYYSWAGGALNIGAGIYSFAMGNSNTVEFGSSGGIALGGVNKIWGAGSPAYGVALGGNNDVLESYGIAAGYSNWSNGTAAVALGYTSTADADHSTAIGYRASTNGHAGAVVISAATTGQDSVEASANNQFTVRASGGIRMFTNATKTTGVTMAAGSGSWIALSDRNRKEGFLNVDGEDILSRIRLVPVTSWRYRDEEDRATRHIGPMSQDWQRAFGLGADTTGINMSDFDGVNLAAVQALERRTTSLAEENRLLAATTVALKQQNEELRRRLERIEALIAAQR